MYDTMEEKKIVCPYCFNAKAKNPGEPFSHRDVMFRATTVKKQTEIKDAIGKTEQEISFMQSGPEKTEYEKKQKLFSKFIAKKDEVFEAFWRDHGGTTTERGTLINGAQPWERPIISEKEGTARYIEEDGFVFQAVDSFGATTNDRVCPYCHNPLPVGFGKHTVKTISVIGTTGSGKTVYISQLLRRIDCYAAKAGLSAFHNTQHVRDFLMSNRVDMGKHLPDSTTPDKLSQPMFYDIVQGGNDPLARHTDTIVIYDIAGENCENAESMVRVAPFVEHSDGLILLIDPKQVNLVRSTAGERIDAPTLTLNTLHGALRQNNGAKADIPVAVCISKSDQCFDVLPPIAREDVRVAERDRNGQAVQKFDGESFNQLVDWMSEQMNDRATAVVTILQNNYLNYNFFAVSAIGCECDENNAPVEQPAPKRIEEPVLWLFKQFGFIKSNTKVKRPYSITNAPSYTYVGNKLDRLLRKDYLIQQRTTYSEYEEDPIYAEKRVFKDGQWIDMAGYYDTLRVEKQGEE